MATFTYKVVVREIDPATGVATRQLLGSPKVSTAYKIRYIIEIFDASNNRVNGEAHVSLSASSSPANISGGAWITSGSTTGPTGDKNYYIDISGTGQCQVVPTFDISSGGTPATLVGVVPTPIFTKSAVTPTMPVNSQIQKDLQAHPLSTTADVVYNPCAGATNNVWAALLITDNVGFYATAYTYQISYYTATGAAGAPSTTFTNSNKTNIDYVLRDNRPGTAYHNAASALLNIKTGANCPTTNTLLTGPAGNNALVGTNDPATGGKFNPPDHIYARSSSLGVTSSFNTTTSETELNAYLGAVKNSSLGYIIQEINSAMALSKTKANSLSITDLWGFRFMYNPTTISYGTQSISNLDYTTFSNDPANLVSGNTTVNFDLYLNRMPDMMTLNPNGQDYSSWSTFYPDTTKGSITTADHQQILKRGTEYDLEFLYRVVNGDPQTNNVTTLGPSSDYGYITGAPFWLYIHDNLRYFCALTSLNVNHLIFTPDMVPVLSVVNLSLVRYPTQADANLLKTLTTTTK